MFTLQWWCFIDDDGDDDDGDHEGDQSTSSIITTNIMNITMTFKMLMALAIK